MKKIILPIVVVALAACSTSTPAPTPIDKQEQSARVVEKNTPEWFLTMQQSPSAYKSVGDGASSSMSGALSNARTAAFEGICQAAGSIVRSQSKQFRQDTDSSSSSLTTSVTRNFCPDVDMTGAVVEKQHVIRDGSRFRAFVLVSLDKGVSTDKSTRNTAAQEFKELDQLNEDHQSRK